MPMNGDLNPHDSTLDHLLEGFQLISHDWRYLYVNDAVVQQSKYPAKESLLGFTMMEKFPGIEKTRMFQTLKRCMSERVSDHFDNEFEFPDGSKGWFELRIHPVPEGIFILSVDITARKLAEQRKQAYINGLEEMIFMTSHRVRQPIVNILGVLDLLERSSISLEEMSLVVGSMKESISSLDEFTRELTSYIHELNEKTQNGEAA